MYAACWCDEGSCAHYVMYVPIRNLDDISIMGSVVAYKKMSQSLQLRVRNCRVATTKVQRLQSRMKTLDSHGPMKILWAAETTAIFCMADYVKFILIVSCILCTCKVIRRPLCSPAVFAFIDGDRVGVVEDINITS